MFRLHSGIYNNKLAALKGVCGMRNFNFSVIKTKIDNLFPGCQESHLYNGYYSNVYTHPGNWPTSWTIVYGLKGVSITVDDQNQNRHTIHSCVIQYKDLLKGGEITLNWVCNYIYDAYDCDANCVDASHRQKVAL